MIDRREWGVNRLKVSSLREGFFSRRSDLTTIATSMRFRISCLQQAGLVPCTDSYRMTAASLEPVNGSL